MSENKRFEDWEQVDCNQCARYWDSSCDSVSEGKNRPCNSFLATRSVVIPAKIKSLENRVKWLSISCLCGSLAFLIHLLTEIFGG